MKAWFAGLAGVQKDFVRTPKSVRMDEKKEKITGNAEPPCKDWREIPFDATTNFSIFGWLLEKLKKSADLKKNTDFELKE